MLLTQKLLPCRIWLISILYCLVFTWVSASAQTLDQLKLAASPEEAGITFQIDTLELLRSDQIFPAEITGPVWSIHAQASYGKVLVQIPILLTPGKMPVEITNSFLKLAKGTFIGFRINDFGESADLLAKAKEDFREFEVGSKRLLKRKKDPVRTPPSVTKKFILMPNGKLRFKVAKLSRRHAAVVEAGDSYYRYKNDMKLYQAIRPKPPERPKDRDPATQRQFQLANRAYRKAFSKWLTLGKNFRKLPKELTLDAPVRIWVIFEIDGDKEELRFSGPKPLPWIIRKEVLLQLKQIITQEAKGEEDIDGVERLSEPFENVVLELSDLISKPHPYNLQLAAMTLGMTHMVRYARLGDAQFFLLKTLLENKDPLARKFVLAELRQTLPPTRATMKLAKLVVVQNVGDIHEKSAAIVEMVKAVRSDPQQASQTALTLSTMLQDEKGVAPAKLLTPLFEASADNEETFNIFAQSIRFQAMPQSRLNDVMVFIVENAGAEPLAAQWLDEQFLSSPNRATLQKTLSIIAHADTGARDLGPLFSWAVGKLFGTRRNSDGQNFTRKAHMRKLIPIDSIHHGLFRALQYGDKKIRALAWQSLSRFTFPLLPQTDVSEEEVLNDRYQVLLDAALDQLPTPSSVVPFLAAQPNKRRAAQTLIQIVLRGSPPAGAAAIGALVGGGAPLGDVMLGMEPGERQGFAMLVYEIGAKRVPPPLVVNVLRRREKNNPIARWFGDEVAKGRIPRISAWADQFEGEGKLLELIASNDAQLAKGAAAALLASVGGKDRDALKFLQQISGLGDQTLESVSKAWAQQKQILFARQLKQYEDHFRLVLLLAEVDDLGDGQDIPMREIPVGVVQLRVDTDQNTVSLGHEALQVTIGDERDSIVIGSPGELKSFPDEELAKIPLEQVEKPIVLKRQKTGVWEGPFLLKDGTKAKLRMLAVEKTKVASDSGSEL